MLVDNTVYHIIGIESPDAYTSLCGVPCGVPRSVGVLRRWNIRVEDWVWDTEPTCDACILLSMTVTPEKLQCDCNSCVYLKNV